MCTLPTERSLKKRYVKGHADRALCEFSKHIQGYFLLKFVEQDIGKLMSDLLRKTISRYIKVKKKVQPFGHWVSGKKCLTRLDSVPLSPLSVRVKYGDSLNKHAQ